MRGLWILDMSIDTAENQIPQFRSTDPITSKIARKSDTLEARILSVLLTVGPCTSWELVTHLNEQRDSYTRDREPREVTIDSVSTCMRPMCRRGEVHEEGMKENMVRNTGNKVIIWAYGPSPDWQPGRSMPQRKTGPRAKFSFE